jgi:hypothetical protein
MSQRAEQLAKRVEQGANELSTFVEGLSDTDWKAKVPRDGRPIGVIVHHVASMYPIEVDVARRMTAGQPITDVTWEVVAGINAAHAEEKAAVTKAEALKLLRDNAREAAAAIRTFTDAQLDTAAPFALSFGAPVTTQFVIEDHALRHAWHHLARMRAALGR